MSIKLSLPATAQNDLTNVAGKAPEVQQVQKEIRDIQSTIGNQIQKVFKQVFTEKVSPSALFDALRSPEKVIPKKESPKNNLVWADEKNNQLETEPKEYELLKLIQSIHDTISQIEKHQKTHEEKRKAADSARVRLSKITNALNNKGLEVKVDELTEETFREELEKQAPEKEKESWEAPLKGIWNQHKEYVPDYREQIETAAKLPSKQELENVLEVDQETREQLKKLLKRLSEKPEMHTETINDLHFLLKKYMEALTKKLTRMEIPLPSSPSEWYTLQNLISKKITFTIEKPEIDEMDDDLDDTSILSRKAKWYMTLAIGALAGIYGIYEARTSPTPVQTQDLATQPTPTIPEAIPTPAPVVESDLLHPQLGTALSADTNLTLRSTDPQFQPLIGEINSLRQNGLRKVKEWLPVIDKGNIILFYDAVDLKNYPQLTKANPEALRILSIVCTDGTKRRDGQEILFDACFEIILGDKRYLVIEDLSVQGEIPEDRIIAPYKIFELQEDGQVDLALLVQRNERNNSHRLEITGNVGDKTISANASLRPDVGDETSEVVGVISGILLMNR
jgi:hypothetical protein